MGGLHGEDDGRSVRRACAGGIRARAPLRDRPRVAEDMVHRSLRRRAGERWEFAFHVPPQHRAGLFGYVDSVGCRYWAVANTLPDRAAYEALGIADRYWRSSQVVVRDETATIYKIAP